MRAASAVALLLHVVTVAPAASFLSALPHGCAHGSRMGSKIIGSPTSNLGRARNRKSAGLQLQSESHAKQSVCPLLPPVENPDATFEAAMGWFWGPQRDFDRVEGVVETVAGYSGSHSPDTANPTYQHIQDYAESIRVTFDPSTLDYTDMLKLFFEFHVPADPRWAGTQYRSAIFIHTEEQRKLAEQVLKAQGTIERFVAVEDSSDFYRGEEYHQKYLDKLIM